MKKYLDNLLDEKNISLESILEVNGESGINIIPLSVLIDVIKRTSRPEKEAIRTMLVKIDFMNGDIMPYFKHLAQAIAV